MIATFSADSFLTTLNNFCDSFLLNAEVGSSIIIIFASRDIALIISKSCCSPTLKSFTFVFGSTCKSTSLNNSIDCLFIELKSINPFFFNISLPRKIFSAAVISGTSCNS